MEKNYLKKILTLALIIASIFFSIYVKFFEEEENLDNLVAVHYIDVNQGDSTFINIENKYKILIDAGNEEEGEKVVKYLKKHGGEEIDLLIASHPDADHIGGIDKVIKKINIKNFAAPKKRVKTKQYKEMVEAAKEKSLKIENLYAFDTFKIDKNTNVTVLSPKKNKKYKDTNENSIVIKLDYKNTGFIFMADATMENEMDIITDFTVKNNYNLKTDVLKLGHHGSSTSTAEYFLKKTNPKFVVISCGKNNRYNHPHREIINLIKKYNLGVFRTDEMGTIEIKSDGDKLYSQKSPVYF